MARGRAEATYSRTPAPSGHGCSENSPWLVARLHAWLSQFRDGAYLLQHAQVIGVAPVLHKLAVLIAPYMGLCPRYLSAGRSEPKNSPRCVPRAVMLPAAISPSAKTLSTV